MPTSRSDRHISLETVNLITAWFCICLLICIYGLQQSKRYYSLSPSSMSSLVDIASALEEGSITRVTEEISAEKKGVGAVVALGEEIEPSVSRAVEMLVAGRASSYRYRNFVSYNDWGVWRRAKKSYYRGKYSKAFEISSIAAQKFGYRSPSLHWIAGLSAWHLGYYRQAARHFTMMALSTRKISNKELAAANFWAARSHDIIGNKLLSRYFLHRASRYPSSLYGFLAAVRINDNVSEADRRTAIADLIKNSDDVLEYGNGYPIPEWVENLHRKSDKAMVLAITRQESNFRANVTSHAGAQGLMQIMPSTADFLIKQKHVLEFEVASNSDIVLLEKYFPSYDLKEIYFNLHLGQSYIEHLREHPYVGTKLPLIAAAYNAGPARARLWYGRVSSDALLFMESIPFTETRNYVKNVMRNYVIYSFMLGGSTDAALQFSKGRWAEIG